MSNRQWPALPESFVGKIRGRRRRARQLARAGFIGALSAALVVGGAGMAGAVEPDPGDLDFILRQIKISEAHPQGDVLGPNAATDVISPLLPEGLRTVTGIYNNLVPGREGFGAADRVFPRDLTPLWRDGDAWTVDWDRQGPLGVGTPTSYLQTRGIVEDADPRLISNLVVDMSDRNPAAVDVAARTPNAGPVVGAPNLFRIPNRAPDEGLSAPYNAWFTAFGQFFDHGLDLVTKGNSGTIMMPLQPDDPLFQPGVPTNFMALTRASNLPGPDGIVGDLPATPVDESADDKHEHTNVTSPFVDQNQTYTSHPSHQVFLREYALNAQGRPVSTGRMLDSVAHGGGLATWADVKNQARDLLGIELDDQEVLNVPEVLTDAYGRFIPDPATGFPQLVTGKSPLTTVSGTPTSPVDATQALRIHHAFLDDIAHAAVPSTTRPYDSALLGDHFITGDGRGNENIGLTAVHHVFHAEHNRLVEKIKELVLAQPNAVVDEWQLGDGSVTPTGIWDGERLFQAARFMTEMEYQHLVFEEFARKVQPAVDVFVGTQTDIDPAITAEFAHTVYRFGHSMLTEQVARTTADGVVRDIDLLDAFLNPREFNRAADGSHLSADAAAGELARGMSAQIGNEIDEFVTDGVRNTLLGLPLDLAAINIARARDTGVPSLNSARREFYAATSHPALAPYTSWTDFGLGLRNPESLVNFVAAYGTHPSVLNATSVVGKRAAAQLLVNGGVAAPTDRVDFLESTGAWASDASGVTNTGLDDVDFWVGGLAEKQMPFGGLLGSTFNFVFETQMEKLQDGDRLYYLKRVEGLNFLTQLEENSFAELVMRTTNATHLPFDVFSTPDYRFELAQVGNSGPILEDPHTPYSEPELLTRLGGVTRFAGPEHVLMGGTSEANNMRTGDGDDTIWGDGGDDRIEGGAGNDSLNGNNRDDVITDIFGDDNIKGGTGHDAINAGSGIDLILAGFGSDFVIAGSDPKETFAGEGDDFVVAGNSADVVFGNGGNDWMEGGSQADLLNGEHAEPFFEDNAPSHDVLKGDGGDDETHTEGGDDVIIQGPGLDFNEGMLGFDWATHRGDPLPGQTDLNNTDLQFPDQTNLFDRFDFVEGLSGWEHNDELYGTNTTRDALTQPSVDLVDGLAGVIGTVSLDSVGNVILGGDGSDKIEGRGGNDVIDGDAWLNVQLEAPNPATQDPDDRKLYDNMRQLQSEVFAQQIRPNQINIVRSIETVPAGSGSDGDTAVFSDNRAAYTITTAGHVVTVDGPDGVDTLRNVEALEFADTRVELAALTGNTPATGEVTIDDTTPVEGQLLTADGSGITDLDGFDPANVTYTWQVESHSVLSGPNRWQSVATGTTFTPDDDAVGRRVRVVATFVDNGVPALAETVMSSPTGAVGNVNDPATGAPGVESLPYEVRKELTATLSGIVEPDGRAGATYRYQWQIAGTTPVNIPGARGQKFTPQDEHGGQQLQVRVTYTDDQGAPETLTSNPFTVQAIASDAPQLAGVKAGPESALVSWSAPARDGGSPIAGYKVQVRNLTTGVIGEVDVDTPVLEQVVANLVNGDQYVFSVAAVNEAGKVSDYSTESQPVVPGPLPAAPAAVTATGGNGTAHIEWSAVVDATEPITGYLVRVLNAGNQVGTYEPGPNETSYDVGGLTNGVTYTVQVSAVNRIGPGDPAETTVVPATVATAPQNVTAYPGVGSARVEWTEPADDGGSAVTGYTVRVLNASGSPVGEPRTAGPNATSLLVDGLTNRRTYRFEVWAVNGKGDGALAVSNEVTPANLPGAPRIKSPANGPNGGDVTVTARWDEPRRDGGSDITGYRVVALRVTGTGWRRVQDRVWSAMVGPRERSLRMVVPDGVYRINVRAYNAIGRSKWSGRSKAIEAR